MQLTSSTLQFSTIAVADASLRPGPRIAVAVASLGHGRGSPRELQTAPPTDPLGSGRALPLPGAYRTR